MIPLLEHRVGPRHAPQIDPRARALGARRALASAGLASPERLRRAPRRQLMRVLSAAEYARVLDALEAGDDALRKFLGGTPPPA